MQQTRYDVISNKNKIISMKDVSGEYELSYFVKLINFISKHISRNIKSKQSYFEPYYASLYLQLR